MAREINFISINGAEPGEVLAYIAVVKGTAIEVALIDSLIDSNVNFSKGNEYDYNSFDGVDFHSMDGLSVIASPDSVERYERFKKMQ